MPRRTSALLDDLKLESRGRRLEAIVGPVSRSYNRLWSDRGTQPEHEDVPEGDSLGSSAAGREESHREEAQRRERPELLAAREEARGSHAVVPDAAVVGGKGAARERRPAGQRREEAGCRRSTAERGSA